MWDCKELHHLFPRRPVGYEIGRHPQLECSVKCEGVFDIKYKAMSMFPSMQLMHSLTKEKALLIH